MGEVSLADLADDADEVVRRRARLVRDVLSLGPTRAAADNGVSRQTAAKWAKRYRASGIAALSRPGHRRGAERALRQAILTAPLWMPSTEWSTRSIAIALGVSQSAVSRAWENMRSGTVLTAAVAARTAGHRPELLGMLVTRDYCVLVFQLEGTAGGAGPDARARADTRLQRSLRTVLTPEFIRAQVPDTSVGDVRAFWDRVADASGAASPLLAVASRDAPTPSRVAVRQVCRDATEWQSLFALLLEWAPVLSAATAQQLERELRSWARAPDRAFTWVKPSAPAPDSRRPARTSKRHLGPERALADEIVMTIRRGIAGGRLQAGDRVSERSLASQLRTTRGQIRTAIRLLERDGLLTMTTGHAAVVPLLTRDDVVETYAARRALGALVIRAAVRWPREARQSVAESLDALERCAATGDVHRVSQADIDFQNALAEASGLVRIAPMLEILADHLRMFIAVMGLDYAYPIDAILEDDRGIFEAVDAGDGETAAQRWRAKVDDAAAYMLRQLTDSTAQPSTAR